MCLGLVWMRLVSSQNLALLDQDRGEYVAARDVVPYPIESGFCVVDRTLCSGDKVSLAKRRGISLAESTLC